MSDDSDKPAKKEPFIQWGRSEVALAKGVIGLLPLGSIFAEMLTEFIPMQRRERIDKYLYALSERLKGMDEAEFERKLKSPEGMYLFEEGGFQTARAVSDERKEYIASVVARGLSGDEIATLQAKRLLIILQSIDDGQIIHLASYLRKNEFNKSFLSKHKDVIQRPLAHLRSPRNEWEARALYDAARSSLVALGLLGTKYHAPAPGAEIVFNTETGTLKSGHTHITTLGRMLLSHVGLGEDEEFRG